MRDFFISYNHHDTAWAEWIAWQLEQAGYTTFIQAWDFAAGRNFVEQMQQSSEDTRATIALFSPNYFNSQYTMQELYAALVEDPLSTKRKVIPVRIADCTPSGLLRDIVYIDLVGKSAKEARKELLLRIAGPTRPENAPSFPVEMPDAVFPEAAQRFDSSDEPEDTTTNEASKLHIPVGVNIRHKPTKLAMEQIISEHPSVLIIRGEHKGLLIEKVKDSLQKEIAARADVVRVDLDLFNDRCLESEEAFYLAMASSFARQLRLPRKLRDAWDEYAGGSMNMDYFMRDDVLAGRVSHLVFVINAVDRLLTCEFRNEVFSLFRTWHINRAIDPTGNWERLTLMLLCRADPNEFIDDPDRSPFNVGTWIAL